MCQPGGPGRESMGESRKTPLHRLLGEAGAKFTEFAGHELPLRFAGRGLVAEHLWCRSRAALFDVSHMCQVRLRDPAGELDSVFPVAPSSLAPGRTRYTQLLNPDGGTVDDLLVSNDGDSLFAVFNASRADVALRALSSLAPRASAERLGDRALVALQGPSAEAALSGAVPGASRLAFMESAWAEFGGAPCRVSRSGYTGEDGFELSVPAGLAEDLCRALASHPDVGYAGLGARDSLRIEAGLCLYGHELDESVTPVEAGLSWSIPPSRRVAGAYSGSGRVAGQLAAGTDRTLVGLAVLGKVPVRQGAALLDGGGPVGTVTSGVHSSTLGRPVALGYVPPPCSAPGFRLSAEVRGRPVECEVVRLPFVAHNYRRRGNG